MTSCHCRKHTASHIKMYCSPVTSIICPPRLFSIWLNDSQWNGGSNFYTASLERGNKDTRSLCRIIFFLTSKAHCIFWGLKGKSSFKWRLWENTKPWILQYTNKWRFSDACLARSSPCLPILQYFEHLLRAGSSAGNAMGSRRQSPRVNPHILHDVFIYV